MRVTEQLHHLNLPKYLLEVVNVQLRLVNDLDRHLVNQQRTTIMSDSQTADD